MYPVESGITTAKKGNYIHDSSKGMWYNRGMEIRK